MKSKYNLHDQIITDLPPCTIEYREINNTKIIACGTYDINKGIIKICLYYIDTRERKGELIIFKIEDNKMYSKSP